MLNSGEAKWHALADLVNLATNPSIGSALVQKASTDEQRVHLARSCERRDPKTDQLDLSVLETLLCHSLRSEVDIVHSGTVPTDPETRSQFMMFFRCALEQYAEDYCRSLFTEPLMYLDSLFNRKDGQDHSFALKAMSVTCRMLMDAVLNQGESIPEWVSNVFVRTNRHCTPMLPVTLFFVSWVLGSLSHFGLLRERSAWVEGVPEVLACAAANSNLPLSSEYASLNPMIQEYAVKFRWFCQSLCTETKGLSLRRASSIVLYEEVPNLSAISMMHDESFKENALQLCKFTRACFIVECALPTDRISLTWSRFSQWKHSVLLRSSPRELCTMWQPLAMMSSFYNIQKLQIVKKSFFDVATEIFMNSPLDFASMMDHVGCVIVPMSYLAVQREATAASRTSITEAQILKDFGRDSVVVDGTLLKCSDSGGVDLLKTTLKLSDYLELAPVSRTVLGGDAYDALMYVVGSAVAERLLWVPLDSGPIELYTTVDSGGDKKVGAVARMVFQANLLSESEFRLRDSLGSFCEWARAEVTLVCHAMTAESFAVLNFYSSHSSMSLGDRQKLVQTLYHCVLTDHK
eukprot:ANDGO_03040.mRNA.1 hypothetical protein